MSSILSFTIIGLYTGAAYAIAASGLVLTYTTTRVFNLAHGALGMVMAFTFWDFSQRQHMPMWLALVLVLGVVAPAIGWCVQRFVTRGLGEGPVSVSLVVAGVSMAGAPRGGPWWGGAAHDDGRVRRTPAPGGRGR